MVCVVRASTLCTYIAMALADGRNSTVVADSAARPGANAPQGDVIR
jgi:hypothetical protein